MPAFKVPFSYMGNKARFYDKFIKPQFEKSGRKIYMDPFAGSLSIPLSIKRDFPDVTVYANFYDPELHECLDVKNMSEMYMDIVRLIYGGEPDEISGKIFLNDKPRWAQFKANFSEKVLLKEYCRTCHRLMPKQTVEKIAGAKKQFISAIFSLNANGCALQASFYTEKKAQQIAAWEEAIKGLDVLERKSITELDWDYSNAFVFFDPPYIRSTKIKNGEFVGAQYAGGPGGWLPSHDEDLIKIAKHYPDSDYLFFGSEGNNLLTRVEEDLKVKERLEFKYLQNTFGNCCVRRERAILV